MKKKLILIITIVLAVGALGILLLKFPVTGEKQPIYIALAGPMSGSHQEDGKAMLRGVKMALEQVEKSGGFKDKKIELLLYDEQDERTALEIAAEIVNDGKVHLVIGYYNSTSCLAAGSVLQNNGIPAITASASGVEVTLNNDWYFRVIPDRRFMREFFVYAIRDLLNSRSASIITGKNPYGASISEHFLTAAEEIGIEVIHKWLVESGEKSIDRELNDLVGELRAAQETGTILCSLNNVEAAVNLFTSLRYPGTDYSIIGPTSFSTPAFLNLLKDYPQEQETPGYYINGIYAIAPFMSYLADQPDARSFREEFVGKYGKEPSWVAATHYDAMLMGLAALERAEVQGRIREDRRRIRNALSSFNEKDVAVNGVTGDLYFDEDGNVSLPLTLGVWQNHEFIPAYRQYQLQDSDDSAAGQPESDGGGGGIEINGMRMTPLRVVYSGVDINAIRNIDLERGVFTADFYLWFRFKGVFDNTAITFVNAVKPVTLGEPIIEEMNSDNDVHVRAYRVVADFTMESNTDAYPLDRHTLRISFRHLEETRGNLIYVPDVIGLTGSVGKKNRGETMLEKMSGWETSEIVSRQNIETITVLNREKDFYSGIDTEISIQREGRGILLVKFLLPMFVIITFVYLLFCLPLYLIQLRFSILLSVLLFTFGIRILYGYILPGQDIVQYMVYVVFALIIFSAAVSGGAYWAHQHDYVRTTKCILYKGSFFYLAAAMAGIVFLLYSHSYFPWLQISSISTQWEKVAWLMDEIKEITVPLLR